jgi:hypothetical protein
VRQISSLWLLAPDELQTGLPSGYVLSVSVDGDHYTELRNVKDRVQVGYIKGDRVYLAGHYGMMEINFPATPARFLQLRFVRNRNFLSVRRLDIWRLAEIFVFEASSKPQQAINTEVDSIEAAIRNDQIDFVVTDRWLSARLIDRLKDSRKKDYPAYPRYLPYFSLTSLSRHIEPRRGLALVVRQEVVQECENLLMEFFGPNFVWKKIDFPDYRMIFFDDCTKRQPDCTLVWNGHTIIKKVDARPLWN